MLINLKDKHTLQVDQFNFRCCIGKKGLTKKKIEGDKKTPIGVFKVGNLYYRNDRINKPETKLKTIAIDKNLRCGDDILDKETYNKLSKLKKKFSYEKLFRKDNKYDLLIEIKFNSKRKIGCGSCIFIHLTKNYNPTAGCIALKKNDFLIMLKLINKKTKIRIS